MDTEALYPVLFLPNKCFRLEATCEVTGDVLRDLSITATNTDGNEICLYSGLCYIKLIDSYDDSLAELEQTRSMSVQDAAGIDQTQVVEGNNQSSYPPCSQSQVGIDPERSPYVHNSYQSQAKYSVHHQVHSSHITVEQHNINITQNLNNCSEFIHDSPAEEFEQKQFRSIQAGETNPQTSFSDLTNPYEDEFECGEFFSLLSKEIINEKEAGAKEEMQLQSGNYALKRPMLSDTQSVTKRQKTIVFLGQDSHFGQTIQKIAVKDPSLECVPEGEMDQEVVVDNVNNTRPNPKKYQCDKCMRIFDQIAAFKQHVVGMHKHGDSEASSSEVEVKFMCTECDKSFKSQEKFELHCLGHGDPELECDKCRKVYASKFTLRTHQKIHYQKHQCDYRTKTFTRKDEQRAHAVKTHSIHACNFTTAKYEDDYCWNTDGILLAHNTQHDDRQDTNKHCIRTVLPDCSNSNSSPDRGTTPPYPSPSSTPNAYTHIHIPRPTEDEIREADSVIAKVMSNKLFLLHRKKGRGRYRKACNICSKLFVRLGNLKRHLIEHVIKWTLVKNPVNKNGILDMQCVVCQAQTFSKVHEYKAHLREHAKLTLYQCTLCNKSFSDSSNFRKHKKFHAATYFQCDLCQRKFNSKKMITKHMEYHNNNSSIPCPCCNKEFHFESMLKAHIKSAHTKQMSKRYRCILCHQYFKTLKEKWDHEWAIHNVRKVIVDCLICGSKFRKYSELKRHYKGIH